MMGGRAGRLGAALAGVTGVSMRMSSFLRAVCLLMVPAMGLAACGDPVTSTSPSSTSTVAIQVYAGPLDPGGTANYLVTLDADETMQVTLVGEQLSDPLRTLDLPLTISIGTWDGSTCTPKSSATVTPRLTTQLQLYLTATTYCVQVADAGSLTQTIGSIVRVAFPAPKLLNPTISPSTLSSSVVPGGVSSKTFIAGIEGDVTVTLKSLGSTARTVGLGLGVYGTDVTTACTLTKIVNVAPGSTPQISAHVDPGTYCAAVFDAGTITVPTTFSLEITNP